MLKTDVLGTSQGRHYAQVTLGHNYENLGMSLQNLWDIW